MSESKASFGETATKLSRSPLGIIGLFIVLVDLFAAAVAGPFGSHLNPIQVWALLAFIIGFPLVVFVSFVWLLVKHHTKLYAPSDYRTDDAFIKTLSVHEQYLRISQKTAPTPENKENAKQQLDDIRYSLKRDVKKTPNMIEEKQRREDYLIAEDLSLRVLQAEFKESIKRQASFNIGDEKLTYDGIILTKKGILLIEVKFVRFKRVIERQFDDIVKKAIEVAKHAQQNKTPYDVELLIAIVCDVPEDEALEIQKTLNVKAQMVPINVTMKYFDYKQLRSEFGIE